MWQTSDGLHIKAISLSIRDLQATISLNRLSGSDGGLYCRGMKIYSKIILILLFTGVHQPAFASGVYKCVGSDGEMTFSFTPCAAEAPVLAVIEEKPTFSRGKELYQVDADIQSTQDELYRVKKNYETSLLTSNGNNTDFLTTEFDQTSTDLLDQLNQLRTQRAQIALR